MKKPATMAQKMRITAGIVYLVLSVYQMLTTIVVLKNATLQMAPFSWMGAIAIAPLAGIMAIWMLSSNAPLSLGARRGTIAGTFLVIVFELLTYTEQVNIINYAFSQYIPSLYSADGSGFALKAALLVGLLLMILGAFFAASSSDSMAEEKEEKVKKPAVIAAEAKEVVPATSKAAQRSELDKPLTLSKDEKSPIEDKMPPVRPMAKKPEEKKEKPE